MKASGESGSASRYFSPLDLVVGQGPQPDAAALQVVDRPHRLEVAPAQAVDGGQHQDVALSELLVQDVPLVAAVVVLGPRRRDVGVDPAPWSTPASTSWRRWTWGSLPGVARLLVPAGADVAVGGHMAHLTLFRQGVTRSNCHHFRQWRNTGVSRQATSTSVKQSGVLEARPTLGSSHGTLSTPPPQSSNPGRSCRPSRARRGSGADLPAAGPNPGARCPWSSPALTRVPSSPGSGSVIRHLR